MTRSQFFKHFDLLADQPDAVAKMRELVLELAVRGKLVSNGSKADKDLLWTKFLADTAASSGELEPAFDVPGHWCWARLADVAAPCGQKKPDTRFTYVDVGAIDNERGVIKESVEVLAPEDAPSRARKLVVQNAVIYSTVRPYLKNIAIIDRKFSPPAIVSTAFAVLNQKAILDSRYLYHWLRSRSFQADVESKMKGVAYPAISDSEFWQCLIPIPPLAEQRRIVAKVDELMALCDELEQRQQARQHASGLLQQSALHHLLAAREPQAFAAAWQRVRDHFHLLHDTPDAIPQLRQAILQLAVQGRLVPHEKMRDQVIECADATDVFPIPAAWQWVTFQVLTESAFTGLERSKAEQSPSREFAYMKMNNITNEGGCDLAAVIRVDADSDEVEKFSLQPGDFLFNTRNSFELVGKTCVFQPDRKDVFLFNNNMLKVSFIGGVDQRFINLWCCSPIGRSELTKLKSATTNVAAIYQGKLATLPVPLPPLAEQKRIVARVEELLRWCDTLEAQLHQTRTLGAHLLASTLHHLLAA